MTARSTQKSIPFFRAGLSFLIPGLGQAFKRDFKRAFGIFFAVATILAVVYWYFQTTHQIGWFVLVVFLWLWNVWDAYSKKEAPIIIAALLWLGAAYGIGWRSTGVDFVALFSNGERARAIISPMLHPNFLTKPSTSLESYVEVQIPCSSTPPKAERTDPNGIHMLLTPDCGTLGDSFVLEADGLAPDFPVNITWSTPTGESMMIGPGFSSMLTVNTDSQGKLIATIQVPPTALIQIPDHTKSFIHRVDIIQTKILPGVELSSDGKYVVQGIYETIAMALLATALGALIAIPFGFLAARNLMSANLITKGIYFIIRSILNIVRSIEVLIWGIIFVIIIGLGTFAGMLAITIHTIAALGKLYSEVIEGIDPGPIEAIKATGANWFQIIRYGVLPQVVPPFTALTIYRWDINVRSSTIVGFVGGGGIGLYLIQWINIADYRAVSSAFIAIVIVVILMDFFSAQLRKRII